MNVRHFGALVALTILAGCGGGGSSNGPPIFNFPNSNMSRVGTWTGRETDGASGTAGSMTMVIADDRSITGTWQTDAGAVYTIAGSTADDEFITVPADKFITISLTSPGLPTLREQGVLLVGVDGLLAGNIMQPVGALPATRFAISLARQ